MLHRGWNIVDVIHVAIRYCIRDAYNNEMLYTWRYVRITHENVHVAHGKEYCSRDAYGNEMLYTWRYVLITHGNVYVAHGMEYCRRDAHVPCTHHHLDTWGPG